ncbi:hypothetical protein CH371_20135 [Leptospira wolffii]|uniref:Uncharacterized protein n=1 Tax=Leptospira wolffii TaxID=409998 RepID=A0A2M9Z6K9_9LEPT|nr:hypothetical protein [Leptospira wolffii]PJZ64055.1 hypothetical protein CH371_20135 [Leptospira wolffii]
MADDITKKIQMTGEAIEDFEILLNTMFKAPDHLKIVQLISEWSGKNYLSFKFSNNGKNIIFKRLTGIKPLPLRNNELAREPVSISNFNYPIIVLALDFQTEFRIEGRVLGKLIPYPVYLADKNIFNTFETPFAYFKSSLLSNQVALLDRLKELVKN